MLLDALDMSRYFSALTGRDSLGASKPDPNNSAAPSPSPRATHRAPS